MTEPPVEVPITAEDEVADRLDDLTKRLTVARLRDGPVLQVIGMIPGSVSSDRLPELRAHEGVKAVEVSGEFALTPPQSVVQ